MTPDTNSPTPVKPKTPFHDLDHFVAIPRLSGLAVNADGTRLVTSVATLNSKCNAYVSALWELDPEGNSPARRITRSAKGESGAAFLVNGDLLFTSTRPDPENSDEDPVSALWKLPAQGGEARIVHSRRGGVQGVVAARKADAAVVVAEVLAGSSDEKDDDERRKARKEAGVEAILHTGYPVRHWDADLGPAEPRFFVVEEGEQEALKPATVDEQPQLALCNVTVGMGTSLRNNSPCISPDGAVIITGQTVPTGKGDQRTVLVRIDSATGDRTVILDSPDYDYDAGPVSPDNSTVVVVISRRTGPTTPPDVKLGLLPVNGGPLAPLAADWDAWPSPAAWLPDGSGLIVTADDDGASPVFTLDVATGAVRRVTQDAASYTDVVVSPDGATAYALRSSYEFPPEVVRIDLASGTVTPLPGPVERPALSGRLERVDTTGEDGHPVKSYLVLPAGAGGSSPAPLLLWIHGGPLGSWNAWTWRWSPWLLAAKGYAVLLPDPALSTGYGQKMIERGWGAWGDAPFTDIMAATDAVVARPDIDESRTAAMGGSFGGYMANWVAGHTDRFNAIVTHASLWALDQFGPTTDASFYWEKEMTPEMALANSPHAHVEKISTPMLVIHGDKDYRVPIGEGLRLWYELLSKSALPADANGETDHRFLYFPDENHWILKPQHAKIWYGVVEHFLARHVLGEKVEVPAELGL
ncbi:dipeptidyl aminopeptidase/acylaminoacyl peptidase [Arthrobacter pigmenti]|uniref:Acyl-peptide hydrolase n=1 Tax=Arthrobacter pigmenti TaxID=271432 RepID=A0A846RZH7_9MICC|nr:prolyl oligopeptidase family serine peptidase [Arthrobacter pigmenti]NJC24366.1 dipeptidyl aminopeptidase/acylaminoacyl peptidase [Arthrobacter pigmenti]